MPINTNQEDATNHQAIIDMLDRCEEIEKEIKTLKEEAKAALIRIRTTPASLANSKQIMNDRQLINNNLKLAKELNEEASSLTLALYQHHC